MKRLPRMLALAVGALFVYAGAAKLGDLNRFMADVYGFRILPWEWSVALALYLPWLEILCGLGLQWRPLRKGALVILSVLAIGFLGVVISALVRGLDIGCGCFGKESAGSLWGALGRDMVLAACIGWLWRLLAPRAPDSENSLPRGQGADQRPAG